MATKKATNAVEEINIPKAKIESVTFRVEGTTSLIVSKFSEKAKQMMLDKQMKKATAGKEAKDPVQQYENSLYKFQDGVRTGFPAVGFKSAMVRAGKQLGMTMTDLRGRFHVCSDDGDLIEIKNVEPRMREDMVRLANSVADVRFRGEYIAGWQCDIKIQYLSNSISSEQLANLLQIAGFSCGIGEWRPEKCNSGGFGLFQLM